MINEGSHVELIREWVRSLLSSAEELLDATKREQLLESCGRACAIHYGAIEMAQSIAKSTAQLDAQLNQVNRKIPWCGKWVNEKGTITSVCASCGCPLVQEGLVTLSPVLCNCSRGYVKAVFEAILERPVYVELEQAIGRGDPVCRFVVRAQ